MGKPYEKELEKIPEIYEWARGIPVNELSKFISKSSKMPLYVIGSGGSFSATTFASLLHQQIGSIAKCLTPLEFLGYKNFDNNCSILIITASGNNNDIISSFDKAVNLKPKNLAIVCASRINKLTKKALKTSGIVVHAVNIPTGKDGFLATNSLIATLIWICKAYIEIGLLPYEIPRFSKLILQNKSKETFEIELTKQIENFQNKETIVLLYDNWGKTAAIDAESKLVEAGLVNVQITDYRNFAHGRHNWLDKNKEKTALLALVNPHCDNLATKTLKLIPEYIPSTSFVTNYDGPIASLALLIKIMFLVKFMGKVRNIDPGKPGVASFGRKIYHLSIPKNSSDILTFSEELAIRRKFYNIFISENDKKNSVSLLHNFINYIQNEKFGAIIFDYDGTLCDPENRFNQPSKKIGELLTSLLKNDIIIGIATGRGKSVRVELQKIIPKNLWSKLYIGYYNCADISTLDNSEHPIINLPIDPNLESFLGFIQEHKMIPLDTKITSRPNQITLESTSLTAIDLINNINKMNKTRLKDIQIVESSHSVDVLPKNISKLNLVNLIRNMISSEYQVLSIGDRGRWPGNDFELLSLRYSLSVDETSDDPKTCWNLLPPNINGESGVLYYLQKIALSKNFFQLKILV